MSLGKKQKLSKDLSRSYILMFGIFTIVGIIISVTTWQYLKDNAKNDVSFTKNFLKGEFMEDEVQSAEDLFKDTKEELPNIEGVIIGIKSGKELYTTGDIPDIDFEYTDRIKRYRGYRYYVYNYNLPVYNDKVIDIIIVKDMYREIKFMYYQVRIYFIASILMLILVYFVYRHYYKKIIPQLSEIENITDSINIDTLNMTIEKTGYYKEFDNILSSYEQMLLRLENQTNAHVEFVHNASHELKTPIFVIKGYSDILSKWGLENKEISDEAIDTIGKEIRGMQSLTEKLLFLAKGRSVEPVKEIIQMSVVIDEIEKELSYRYKGINIEKKIEPVEYSTDKELLKILLKNIIENAMKYGLGKGIKIESTYREGYPAILVKDSGIGMDSREIESIFTEFYRGEKSRSKEIKGHGLGMSIVKTIKSILQIDIKITSKPDVGTTVAIILKDNCNKRLSDL